MRWAARRSGAHSAAEKRSLLGGAERARVEPQGVRHLFRRVPRKRAAMNPVQSPLDEPDARPLPHHPGSRAPGASGTRCTRAHSQGLGQRAAVRAVALRRPLEVAALRFGERENASDGDTALGPGGPTIWSGRCLGRIWAPSASRLAHSRTDRLDSCSQESIRRPWRGSPSTASRATCASCAISATNRTAPQCLR